MADICRGMMSDSEASAGCETASREARRRRMAIRRLKFEADAAVEPDLKRQKMDASNSSPTTSFAWEYQCENALDDVSKPLDLSASRSTRNAVVPRSSVASVCGRRRDMEDAVSVQPFFLRREIGSAVTDLHYFAVFDGHGCSHVAMRCKERLHEVLKEELLNESPASADEEPNSWKEALERSFKKMDDEVIACNEGVLGGCCCEPHTPACDAVGSTAVIAIVTPKKIIVANCGDSRAVLCRNGNAVALSTDHKPDRPDELNRIQEAGGRVIYSDGPRVLGVLAMSRAIGDKYLKPYVSSEPEVTITDRTADDGCLILASDGLWDVVSNDTACAVARMCFRAKAPLTMTSSEMDTEAAAAGNKACSDASMLLTKLAFARHSADNVSVIVVDLSHSCGAHVREEDGQT